MAGLSRDKEWQRALAMLVSVIRKLPSSGADATFPFGRDRGAFMARVQPEVDQDVYGLAPEPPPAVSSATACTATLTDDKRQAIQAYLTKLGPALRDKYGRQSHYTPAQVRDTALARVLRIDYLCWAYVLHCSAPDFEALHTAAGEACDYVAMRSAVGLAFFGGDAGFSTPTVVDAIVSGAGPAVASGATEAVGWLAGVDWSGLLDWS